MIGSHGKWAAALAAALALSGLVCARADEVHLRNGRILDAERIDKGEKLWTLHTSFGAIQVKAEDVVKVVPGRPRAEAKPPDPKDPPVDGAAKGTGTAEAAPAEAVETGPVAEPDPKGPAAAGPANPVEPAADAAGGGKKPCCGKPIQPEYPYGMPGQPGGPPLGGSVAEEIARSEDADAKLELIAEFAESVDPQGLPILVELTRDRIVVVGTAAVRALGAYDESEATLFLLETLQTAGETKYQAALEAVGAWYHRHQEDPEFSLARALGTLDSPRAAQLLFAVANVDYPNVRPTVLEFLEGPDGALRASAVKCMKFYIDKDLKPRLDALLLDPDAGVRRETCFAAVVLKYKAAMPRLVDMLQDPDANVSAAALKALRLLSGVPLPPEPAAWRNYLENRPKKR